MNCHFCDAEAVDRCYSCGRLFCAEHGKTNCRACQNAISAGDPSPHRVAASPQTAAAAAAWWRPQPAEDYTPPACYACKGLTRAHCVICGRHYCAEHAGRRFSCKDCDPGADWTSIFVGGVLLFLLLAALCGYWLS